RSLAKLVKRSKFREDLYYRLNVVKIDLPPLRERKEDVPLLAAHFCSKYARPGEAPKGIAPAAMTKLLGHPWPGNVRELQNAIERASAPPRGRGLEPSDLPLDVLGPRPVPSGVSVDLTRKLPDLLSESAVELEKAYLRKALRRCRGNVGKVASLSGLSRRSISAKLAQYGLHQKQFKREES